MARAEWRGNRGGAVRIRLLGCVLALVSFLGALGICAEANAMGLPQNTSAGAVHVMVEQPPVHVGGIEMAQSAADMAGTDEVRSLAEGMIQGQQSEIALMADMLKERGATADG